MPNTVFPQPFFDVAVGPPRPMPRSYALASRLFDMLLAGSALVVLAPILALVAGLVRLESPGAPLFGQTRVGLRGKTFTIWKFRSMHVDADALRATLEADNEMHGGVTFKMREDPRVTRVGRWLRRLSIDELPQLFNVLTGDMAVVGPRPPIPSEVAQYTARQLRRLDVKPGLTCIWQVSGRSDLPFEDQVELDLEYIATRNLVLDIELILRTVPAVLRGRGAY